MGNLNIRRWCSLNPITQTTDLSSVLELIPLKEEGPEGLTVLAHFRKLLAASEVRIRLEGVW